MSSVQTAAPALPGAGLDARKMPGHWLLARAGKRVLRPGGRALTRRMLRALAIGPADAVVELAPGMGVTARETLACNPTSYVAVERDQNAAERLERWVTGPGRMVRQGHAEQTGLPDSSATVVYGEAMLTMQPPDTKARIVREAHRLLAPGGRYGIHELCLLPDGLADGLRDDILAALAGTIRVGARPLTPAEWRDLLASQGFTVTAEWIVPMHLLEPGRLLQDEGLGRALTVVFNILRDPVARRRIWAMRRAFHTYREHLGAIMLVAARPAEGVR
ncbi:MAG: methyltransferase domain-containing protein [Chloroflexi bacterium]|nr:methyltransferase domain-containing protein [Chloroflexota bacterium]